LGDIDDALANLVSESPWTSDYDLLAGLTGLGVYFVQRLPRENARRSLLEVVDRLDELAVHLSDRITFLTAPELLPPWHPRRAPQGYYNVGLAHGVPGVIALLGKICAEGIAVVKARRLLNGAVRWVLAQQLPKTEATAFPSWVFPGHEPSPARQAWCYGDPGV